MSYSPPLTNASIGDTIDVALVLSSPSTPLANVGAMDAIVKYDPAVLQLLSSDQTGAGYSWFAAGFFTDPDGINSDIADGEAKFTALSQIATPAIVPMAPGLIVTTFQFQVLAASSGTLVSLEASSGSFAFTQVFDFFTAGLVITGDITSVATVVVGAPPVNGPFCAGDGTGTPCPCGANAGPGLGCLNTSGVGAQLVGSGNVSITNDTFQLQVSGVPGNKPGLVLRGANQLNGSAGVMSGDGLLCTAGLSARSQVQITSAGSTLYTDFSGQPFGAMSYGAGSITNYQFWYRDPMGTCSGAGFNFTNAWEVTWLP